MSDERTLPENLRAGTIAVVEQCECVNLLSDWTWHTEANGWVLHCQLCPQVACDSPIPLTTDWYVIVRGEYPWGSIKFYPAKKGGITQTFSHQSYNGFGKPELPWRTGDLCLTTSVRTLGRSGLEQEPFDAYNRLPWTFQRANEWLIAASRNELMRSDEPYELPQFVSATDKNLSLIAFQEDEISFAIWKREGSCSGVVDFARTSECMSVFVIKGFRTFDDAPIYQPRWGSALSQSKVEGQGLWILLDECPLLFPWQAPQTWGELRRVAKSQNVDVDAFILKAARHLSSKPNLLLIGFPIPKWHGGEVVQIHWIALDLPFQSAGKHQGFRNTEAGRRCRDKLLLRADPNLIRWQLTQNWTPTTIQARGRLPQLFTDRKIVLIGAGALGSALAELMVRAGVNNLTVIDGDVFQAGNLARHTLMLGDVMRSKADALAARLNLLSPFAWVHGINANFPDLPKEFLPGVHESDVVIDCTGDDRVLHALGAFPWRTNKQFVSLSLGLHAHRLFCFAAHSRRFPAAIFDQLVAPWLLQENEEFAGYELPREGLGCWHPVFPARADDMTMLAGVAVKYVERILLATNAFLPYLTVYEQEKDSAGFVKVRRVVEATEK